MDGETEAQEARELPEATPWVKGRAETQTRVFVRSEFGPFRWISLKLSLAQLVVTQAI